MTNIEGIKRKRVKIPIQLKQQIIENREKGVKVSKLAQMYNRSTSTICSILKEKNMLKTLTASKGLSRRSEKRADVLNEVERLLLIWINQQRSKTGHLTQNVICEEAKRIYKDILERTPSTAARPKSVFKASNGWFQRFKQRTEIDSIIRRPKLGRPSKHKVANTVHQQKASKQRKRKTKIPVASQQLPNSANFIQGDARSGCEQNFHTTSPRTKPGPGLRRAPEPDTSDSDEPSMENMEDSRSVLKEVIQNTIEEIKENLSSAEESSTPPSNVDIREVLKAWNMVSSFVSEHHPYESVAEQVNDIYESVAIAYFRQELAQRRKPTTIDNFVKKIN